MRSEVVVRTQFANCIGPQMCLSVYGSTFQKHAQLQPLKCKTDLRTVIVSKKAMGKKT